MRPARHRHSTLRRRWSQQRGERRADVGGAIRIGSVIAEVSQLDWPSRCKLHLRAAPRFVQLVGLQLAAGPELGVVGHGQRGDEKYPWSQPQHWADVARV